MVRGVQIIEQERGDMPSDTLSLATRMPEGQMVVSERTLFGDVITAQPIRAPRDEGKVLRKIEQMAGAAGQGWYYRFPVKKKGGGLDYIEGPSIDCTDAIARWYGNCQVASAVQDVGPAWIIHSRFVDLETGYTLIRPFLQSKTGSRLGGDDDERRLQIALGIGTSKSQRNVVVHALRDFTDRAFEAAKKNLVERIGANLPAARKRCTDKLVELGGDELLARVERAFNRKADQWLAPDVARLVAEIATVVDGMALIDDVWPGDPPPEPRRSDAPTNGPSASAAAAAGVSAPAQPEGEAAPHAAEAVGGAPNTADPPTGTESAPAADVPPEKRNWSLPDDILGQANVLKALGELLDMTASEAEINLLLEANALRIAKITGQPMQQWRSAVSLRRRQFKPGGEP
jgi:hypothetical protein